MAIWDSTVSSLNPYLWLKMDSGLTNYGSLGSYYNSPATTGTGITYQSSGGKTGAYITYPSNGNTFINFRPVSTSTFLSGMTARTYSVAFWFKKNGVGNDYVTILRAIDSGDGNFQFIIPSTADQYNAGKLVFNLTSSPSSEGSGGGIGGGIPGNTYCAVDNEWHFAAFTINGTTVKFYYDGQNVGQQTLPAGRIAPGRWYLGDNTFSSGALDDLVYFNYTLSDQQMSDLYNATADIARVKWFDSQNWITPQNLFYWNGGSFVPSTNAKVWNGTSWSTISK